MQTRQKDYKFNFAYLGPRIHILDYTVDYDRFASMACRAGFRAWVIISKNGGMGNIVYPLMVVGRPFEASLNQKAPKEEEKSQPRH